MHVVIIIEFDTCCGICFEADKRSDVAPGLRSFDRRPLTSRTGNTDKSQAPPTECCRSFIVLNVLWFHFLWHQEAVWKEAALISIKYCHDSSFPALEKSRFHSECPALVPESLVCGSGSENSNILPQNGQKPGEKLHFEEVFGTFAQACSTVS